MLHESLNSKHETCQTLKLGFYPIKNKYNPNKTYSTSNASNNNENDKLIKEVETNGKLFSFLFWYINRAETIAKNKRKGQQS